MGNQDHRAGLAGELICIGCQGQRGGLNEAIGDQHDSLSGFFGVVGNWLIPCLLSSKKKSNICLTDLMHFK